MEKTAQLYNGISVRFSKLLRSTLLLWENPWSAALITIIIFLEFDILAGAMPWRNSGFAYFNYLADAFNHGQLYLRLTPPNTLDLSFFQNNYYLYWGPLPAVIA